MTMIPMYEKVLHYLAAYRRPWTGFFSSTELPTRSNTSEPRIAPANLMLVLLDSQSRALCPSGSFAVSSYGC